MHASRGGSSAPMLHSIAPTSHGGSVTPPSHGGSVAPASRGGSVVPASRGGFVVPAFHVSVMPTSHGGSVAPTSCGGSVTPTSCRGSTIPPVPPSSRGVSIPMSRSTSIGLVSGSLTETGTISSQQDVSQGPSPYTGYNSDECSTAMDPFPSWSCFIDEKSAEYITETIAEHEAKGVYIPPGESCSVLMK